MTDDDRPLDYSAMTPENTRKAAALAAEAVRFLNHATLFPTAPALEYPSDVDALLADLETLQQRLPQLLGQLGEWMAAECKAGRVRVSCGTYAHSPSTEGIAVSALRQYLTEAAARADGAREALHDARQITAALAGVPGGERDRP